MKKMLRICAFAFVSTLMFTACSEEDLVLNAPSKPDSEQNQNKRQNVHIGSGADEFDRNNEVER